jgi:SAM-dependent methyltransferase
VTEILQMARRLGALAVLHRVNAVVRKIASVTHHWQFKLEWETGAAPEWFDQYLNTHFAWRAYGLPYSWERGLFNLLAMRQGGETLELCCGGGFFTHHFYAQRSARIIAIDIDAAAIAHARRFHRARHVMFEQRDIRTELPQGEFDNILWDAAIEHFTEQEIGALVGGIKSRLRSDGVLSGYTICERDTGKQHPDHEYEFRSKQDLARVFEPHFRNVTVFETIYPDRHNLYFFASDGALPFASEWPAALRIER